jgi:hypothetical protein
MTRDCRRGQFRGMNQDFEREMPLSEYIPPICAAQLESQAFFCIPDRPSEVHARESVTTVVVIVLNGVVSTRQIEEEFSRILPNIWRWTAERAADNMLTIRFSNAQTIKDWKVFNPISLINVKAKVKLDPWNGAIGAKVELEEVWFRVRGIPYDKRSIPTMGYVRSLVGVTREVDKSTMHRADFVRIKIAAREVAKIPEVVEGAIVPYLYDFHFEREIYMGQANRGIEIKVRAEKGGETQPSLKKPRTHQSKKRDNTNLQIEVFLSKVVEENVQGL